MNGEGVKLAKRFEVKAFPTFLLLDAQGETLDRWIGNSGTPGFMVAFRRAVADPTTVEQKLSRQKAHPTVQGALTLAHIREACLQAREAAGFYLEAQELNTDPSVDYSFRLFEARSEAEAGAFTPDEMKSAADAALASKQITLNQILRVARVMADVVKRSGNKRLAQPYLRKAMISSDGVADPDVQEVRRELQVEYALYVIGNEDLALELKRQSLPEDWRMRPFYLNEFAWWCFESHINLEEAEALARKGLKLANSGLERAMILDTLAEICNARGNCMESVHLLEMAVKEAPGSNDYPKKLERFQKLLEDKK